MDADRGFWMPVDAKGNHRSNWISNSDLTDMDKGRRVKSVRPTKLEADA